MEDPTSASGGCLRPVPAFGLDLEDPEVQGLDEGLLDGDIVLVGSEDGRIAAQRLSRFLHDWIACVTGLAGSKLRPRWQPEAPNLPAAGTDWAAFGVVSRRAEPFAFVRHVSEAETDGAGFDEMQRHEELDVLVSFYGPNADAYATALRDNAQIAQNRERLMLAGMGLIETSEITTLPSLMKNLWLYRQDITVRIRRIIVRQFRVESLLAADLKLRVGQTVEGGTINTDAVIPTPEE